MKTMTPEYGTKEYYKIMFADIVGDASDDGFTKATMIVEAFREAIGEWLKYHSDSVNKYLVMQESAKDIYLKEQRNSQL